MSKLATYGVAILILAGFLWFAQDTFTKLPRSSWSC